MHQRIFTAFILLLLSTLPMLGSDETHPFSIHDMLAMQRIADPQVSPDGKLAVFVLRSTDLENDRGRTDLWLIGTDGSGLRQLTTHPDSDGNPRWAPDGQVIWFLSSRSGSSQVWKIRLDGGEAMQAADLPLDAGSLAVSPDGKRLAVSMEVFPDCQSLQCTRDRLDKDAERKSSGQVYDQLFIRHWDTWKDGRRSHLISLPAQGGDAVDVMQSMDADTPSKPFGGPEEYAFTPDSQSLVFTARNAGKQEPWSTNFDLFAAPADGSSPPRNLTAENKAWDTQPVFSPDGSTLAYLAMQRAGFEADRFRIVLMDWPNGERRVLTEDWDRSPGGIAWSADGGHLYASAQNLGQRSLFAIDAASGAVKTLLKDGYNSTPAPAGDRLLFGRDHLRSPVELYSLDPEGGDLKAVTHINDQRVAQAQMGDFEQFSFAGWNGEKVYGYVVQPADFDPSAQYPVAFLIHGGPQGSFGNHFHYRWNPQAYSGAGYAAVMIDFHGSTGYGQDFQDSIRGDWGGKPLEDLQKGLDAALAKYSWLDGERVAALGASYGGYMINWIAGNWPGRFKCLVNHDGLFDMQMMYYVTEELWFPEWEHGGPYYENPQGHERHNPANHVTNWKTPMLVVHGLLDHRVPLGQGIATFTALQRQGVPSRFLYFPDENHWVLSPNNGIQWHEEVLGWLDKWTK